MVQRFLRSSGRAALWSGAVALIGALGLSGANAQYNIGRGPNASIGHRMPNITTGPGLRYMPGLIVPLDMGEPPPPPPRRTGPPPGDPPPSARRATPPAAADSRFVAKELVIEVDGTPTEAEIAALARRFRLTRLEQQAFPLTNSTLFRWRIADGRSVRSVASAITASGAARATPNFRYRLQQAASGAGDATRYPLVKLRLTEAHAVARGTEIVVAVIDSAIDARHPEIDGAVTASFDALGSKEGPHKHGTGIAGAIVSHARLVGSAPAARLLAIRAFAGAGGGAEGTSFGILKSLDFAVARGARVINMSFAGAEDAMLARALAAASARGIVLVAAAGNAGPASPLLYPAAYPQVIAVSATDAADRLFTASNRGKHIAVAAPGVDLLLPSPDGKYQVTSGTSFAAAYVSGLAALMLERNPALTPAELRERLMATARDLGPKGPDDQFGAGLADAAGALAAAVEATPVSSMSSAPSPQ
ncbi:MAG: peptidase S8 [Xanthobacteraceae bacterium]|nr:MAG: peptidase S8 [Xanthobacteraceae bacterium]